MPGRSEVSCNDGTFAVGAFAAAPPAIIKDIPAPNAGKPTRRRFRLETWFVRAIVKPPVRTRRSLISRNREDAVGFLLSPRKLRAELRLRQAVRASNLKRVRF